MRPPRSWHVSPTDSAINLAFLLVFVWAFLEAGQWSFRAALFPRVFVGLGAILCVLRAVVVVRAALAGEPVAGDPTAEAEFGDALAAPGEGRAPSKDDAAGQVDIEYVFGHADLRMWGQALAWIAAFFAGLRLVGLFVIVPVFALTYLIAVARMRWWWAALYAAVAWGVLYGMFGIFLRLRMPQGILF